MAKVTQITSRSNPLLARVRKLVSDPGGYRKSGLLLLEGEHLCAACELQQTIELGSASPMSTLVSCSRSAFGCLTASTTRPTLNFPRFPLACATPRCSMPSISAEATDSFSASSSSGICIGT